MKRRSDSSLKACSSKDGAQSTTGIRTRLSTGTLVMSGTSTTSPSELHFQDRSASPSNSSSAGSDVSHHTGGKDLSPSGRKRKISDNKESGESSSIPPKRKKIGRNDGTGESNKNDYFCWICHKEGVVRCCELCPRVFHAKCLNIENNVPEDWVCPECEKVMKAECTDTRSKAISMISVGTLCTLLHYSLNRMRTIGSETFEHPVNSTLFPNYSDYVFHPMSLSVLEKNIKRKNYGCTEAFLADAKWIFHNSSVYNGAQNKITSVARALLKVCKHEMSEIEVCPDCYYNSCLQRDNNWFCEPCRTPHPLVWAKLKGYPFWPAKALREVNDQVDVRFFGAHDRSWVPVASCFMLSKTCPVLVKKGRGGLQEAMREVDVHVKKLREKLGSFEYAPFRTPYSSDSPYIKLKGVAASSSSSDSSRLVGKILGRPKGADGRIGEKHSVVSKTAMALKSKYISITSKKGAQMPGTVVKVIGPPQQQQRQIIYLKPMPKGVFLLSEQAVEPVAVSCSTRCSNTRPNLPDLQLVKYSSNRAQPESPSSSKPTDVKDAESSHGSKKVKEDLARGKEEQMEVKVGGDVSKGIGGVSVGSIGEEVQDNDILTLSIKNTSTQNDLLSKGVASDVDFTARMLTNAESDILSCQTGIISKENSDEGNKSNQNIQQKLSGFQTGSSIPEEAVLPDLGDMTSSSDGNTESYSSADVLTSNANRLPITTNSQRNGMNAVADVHSERSTFKSVNLAASSGTISSFLDKNVTDPSKQRLVHNESGASVSGADVCTSDVSIIEESVIRICRDRSNVASEKTENFVDSNLTQTQPVGVHGTLEKSSDIFNIDKVSNKDFCGSILEPAVKDGISEQNHLVRDMGRCIQNISVTSPLPCLSSSTSAVSSVPTPAVSSVPTPDMSSVPKSAVSSVPTSGVSSVPTSGVSSVPTSGVSSVPTSDVNSVPTSAVSSVPTSAVSSVPTSAVSSVPTSAVSSVPTSAVSSVPTSAVSSVLTSAVSSVPTSAVSSVPTSAMAVSPGSKYKESLQKVIDSCKAKLGIDDKNDLNNMDDDDGFIFEGDNEEEEGIIVSDNDLDDDSDVLLMDIEDDSREYVHLTLTNSVKNVTQSNTIEEVSSTLDGASHEKCTKQNTQQSGVNLQSETLDKRRVTSSNSDTSSSNLALESWRENKTTAKEKQNDNKTCTNPSDSITELESSVVANSFKNKEIAGESNRKNEAGTDSTTTISVLKNVNTTPINTGSENSIASKTLSATQVEVEHTLQVSKGDVSQVSEVEQVPQVSECDTSQVSEVEQGPQVSECDTSQVSDVNNTPQVSEVEHSSQVSEIEIISQVPEECLDSNVLGEQEVVIEVTNTSRTDDEASIISIGDDEDDDNYIDDDVTLDMEVVCVGQGGDSDEDMGTDNEMPGDVVNRASGNNGTVQSVSPARGLDNNPVQDVGKTPAMTDGTNIQQRQNIPLTLVSYPTLRETLTTVTSSTSNTYRETLAMQNSPALKVSTTCSNSIKVSSSIHSRSSTLQSGSSAGRDTLVLPQQKTRPRILPSKNRKKMPATLLTPENAMVISLDNDEDGDSVDADIVEVSSKTSGGRTSCHEVSTVAENDKEVEATSAAVGQGANHADPERRTSTEEDLSNPSDVLKANMISIIKNRHAVFEKFIVDQLHDMAKEVKTATLQSVPQHFEHDHQQKALDKQKKEYNMKIKDLWKTMNATLKESLAGFKFQKAVLAERLEEEFNKELQKAVADTKKQQWCSECWKEAVYYCCWNTSYCSYQCQQKHWPTHMPKCMQTQSQQSQGTTTQTVSRGPKIISTLNSVNGTIKDSNSNNTASCTSNIIMATTAPTSQHTTAVTPMTVSKPVQRLPTISIVSPSQWKASEEAAKTKKVLSLLSPQSTSAPINTLSIGQSHFQIQYLPQGGTAVTLPQQVQVMGGNPSSIPLLMPSMITSAQNQVASPVHLLQNASMYPLMQQPSQSGIPHTVHPQSQQIGGTRYILPSSFGAFMRPGGPM